MAYQGRQPGVGVRNRFIYSATGGQTSFSGADSNGLTLAYADATYVDVFLNGVLLVPVSDYAATTKTSVVLGSGAAASDIVEIVAYDISSIANAVPISGGTMTGNLTVQGTVAATAVTGDGSGLTGLPAGVGGANGVTFNDNVKAQFGAGNDLQIYHDGSNSYLNNTTGNLTLDASGIVSLDSAFSSGTTGGIIRLNDAGTQFGDLYEDSGNFLIASAQVDKDIIFKGNDGGGIITAMTIDMSAGGNVGIGTNSPDTKVQIKGTINSSQLILGGTDSRGLKISTTNEGGQNDGSVIFDAQDTEGSGVNSNLIFKNGGTESLRINGNGSKDFGSFQAFSGGYNTIIGAGSAASYALRLDATGTGSAGVLQVVNGYGQVGSIRVNGASTQFNTSSDYRLKTDVQPMAGASARVQALNPVNFEWIADGNRTDGFLAHEAQEVVPEAVVGNKDAMRDEPYEVTPAVLDDDGNVTTGAVMGTRSVPDYQGIDQSKLVPLLTAALQEALTEIASLKTRVEALES